MFALLSVRAPEPVLVTAMLPVICELMIRPPEALLSHWWRIRSGPPEVIVPPLSVTVFAATVGVTSKPPLAIVRPAVASRMTGAALLKRRELMLSGLAPMVVAVPLSTFVPAEEA